MCKDDIIIPSKLQGYVLNWQHMYLLNQVIYRMEEMIRQHLYWSDIIDVVRKEVTNCDTCQHTKLSNKNIVDYQLS